MKVIACLAASLDGKIASALSPGERIGSREDWRHLRRVRNLADAIVCGGETFRQHPFLREGDQPTVTPLQCILTRTVDLPPDAKLFRESMQQPQPVPVLIFSPAFPAEAVKSQYPPHVEWIATGEAHPAQAIVKTLEQRGVRTLLVEGGGQVVNLFLQAQAVHELYLTLCPLLLGGQADPALVSGPGFTVSGAPRTEMLSMEARDQEIYLHLRLHYRVGAGRGPYDPPTGVATPDPAMG